MRCPALVELPPPPPGRSGWPWTEDSHPLFDAIPDPSTGFRISDSSWPRISIVTPSYNQSGFLEETIRSVLLQGCPNLEYILIDGGSTDGSVDIIRKYEPWLACWISEPDRGQSHAINKGFSLCSGEIITFLSSDDVYLPGTLVDLGERWANQSKSYGAIIGGFRLQDEHSHFTGEPIPPKLSDEGPLDLTLGPPGAYRLHQVSTFYGREALDDVGRRVQEEMHYVMDRELLYRVCRKYPVLLVDRPYGLFRKHTESKSVRELMPFAHEFASLYLHALSGSPTEDRLRKKMARYRMAQGYIKYAKAADNVLYAVSALIKAILYQPDAAIRWVYLNAWLKALHLKK